MARRLLTVALAGTAVFSLAATAADSGTLRSITTFRHDHTVFRVCRSDRYRRCAPRCKHDYREQRRPLQRIFISCQ